MECRDSLHLSDMFLDDATVRQKLKIELASQGQLATFEKLSTMLGKR